MKCSRRALASEVDIRLVDHHDMSGILPDKPLDLLERQQHARRRIGIRNKNRFSQSEIVAYVDGKVLPQGNLRVRHAVQRRKDRIKAVADIRERRAGIT